METGEHLAHFEEEAPEKSIYELRRIGVLNHSSTRTGPLVFSADSKLLACGQTYRFDLPEENKEAHFISVWTMEIGEHIVRIKDFPEMVYSLSFSPCNRFLAIGGKDGSVQVWTVPILQLHKIYSRTSKEGMYVSYSSEGSLCAAGESQQSITVWDIEQEETLYIYAENDVHFSRPQFINGTYLVCLSLKKLHVWSLDTKKVHSNRHLHHISSDGLVFALDGGTLASIEAWTGVSLWNISNSQDFPQVFDPISKCWCSVDVSAEGKVFATSANENSATLWEVGNDTPLVSFTTEARVIDLVFHQPQISWHATMKVTMSISGIC